MIHQNQTNPRAGAARPEQGGLAPEKGAHEESYELSYAHSYFRTEIPIAVCPTCGVIDGSFRRESSDGVWGGYGTATFSHEHPLVFLILEQEDRHMGGPRSYYIDGEPSENILKLLKKAGRLWKSGWGYIAIEKYLKKILGGIVEEAME